MPDDFIRTAGNLAYTSTWLKLLAFVLLIISLVMTGFAALLIMDRRAENIVPIVINEATGDSLVVDYKVVDAAGEQRSPVEVKKFSEDFLSDAFTFNRFTVKSNLEKLASHSTPEALSQIRESLNLPRRAEQINRSAQGLLEITSFMILESRPAIRTQVYFRTRVFSGSGDLIEENNWLSVITIRPVRRSTRNPHGLIIIEYRQNPFKTTTEESL
jgi:hypothetical protein